MFKDEFFRCLYQYTGPKEAALRWREIEKAYTATGRYYHTLSHLDHLLNELTPYQNQFKQWDIIVFAIGYHDVIYSVLRKDNEEASAKLAVNRLQSFGFDSKQIVHCSHLILATKSHEVGDKETNLFTDGDLSILGASPGYYSTYAGQVRSEYSIFPDDVYNPGRKKVLQHFLNMPRIFKTDEFSNRYETAARFNLQNELSQL